MHRPDDRSDGTPRSGIAARARRRFAGCACCVAAVVATGCGAGDPSRLADPEPRPAVATLTPDADAPGAATPAGPVPGGPGASPVPPTVVPASNRAAALCEAEVVETARVTDPNLDEISGIALTDAGIWVQEDSGASAEVVLLDATGARVATVALDVAAVDWEDMAVDPAGALVVADTGDNGRARASVALVRVPPRATAAGTDRAGVEPQVFPFTYPDVARDVEALLIDPLDGTRIVVTKALNTSTFEFEPETVVYEVPVATPGTMVVAVEVARFDDARFAAITGGAVSRDGALVALRSYDGILVWARPEGATLADALAGEPCAAAAGAERQGEAIAFVPGTDALVTIGEGVNPGIWRTGSS